MGDFENYKTSFHFIRPINTETERVRRLAAARALLIHLNAVQYGKPFSKCRVAYFVDGVEGYAPWHPIGECSRLKVEAKRLGEQSGVRAYVERR